MGKAVDYVVPNSGRLLINYNNNKKAFPTSLPPHQDSSFNWTFPYPAASLCLWYRSATLA